MTNPKISIITASYNYENYIKETIESVLAQNYSNWEMIIVDDGSNNKNILSNLLKTNKESNPIPTFSCVMLKPELISDISYESPYKQILDWYIWLQIAKQSTYYYAEEKLTNWRMHKGSYINSQTNKQELLAFNCQKTFSFWKIFRNNIYHNA